MMNDNEYSNVVDNLSLLIKPVGACRLTAEQQLEALKDAIGCSDGQDWQDQTWVERLIELIKRPTCGNLSFPEEIAIGRFECSRCGATANGFGIHYCPNCGAEVRK